METMINKINAAWEPLGEVPIIYAQDTFKMMKMQKEAYQSLKNCSKIIVNAPTASGKTLAICWLTAKKLTENTSQKAIIAVPQTIIADGFQGPFKLHFDVDENETNPINSDISWNPRHYLCKENIAESNIKRIGGFLGRKGQASNINDRILVCSHASLVDAYKKHPDLFKDIIIVIDETHRSRYSEGEEVEGVGNMVFCNQMGSIIASSLKNKDKNIELILSTATLFRGDRLEIIPEKCKKEFKTFHYPMDEYLKDMPKEDGINSFSYDFAMYKGGFKNKMTELFKDKIGKTIVYVPHILSKKYSSGSKITDWKNVYRAIAGTNKYKIKELDNGITLIQKGNNWVKVINLVDDSDMNLRSKRKNLIIEAHKYKDSSMIDVIIALNMFKEGANWKWADREIIVGTKGSLTDMNQIIGRLFRYAPNKRHIQTIQLLPFSFDQIDKFKFRENLNEYMKIVFATMLLEEAIAPLQINIKNIKNIKNNKNGAIGGEFIDYLREQEKDENKIYSIQREIMIKAIEDQNNGEIDFGCNNKKSIGKFKAITSEVLKNNNIHKYHSEISAQIYKSWMRESVKKIKGINLKEVDFDTIQVNPLDFMIHYTSGMCGLKTFEGYLLAYKDYNFLPFEQARDFVRKQNIKTQREWYKYCESGKKPINIPATPYTVYKGKGWISLGDWLGTDFLPFEQARDFVRKQNIKTQREWSKYCKSGKKPINIPASPYKVYKGKGWISLGDWLGTEFGYLPFEQARDFVRKQNIKTQREWIKYYQSGKKPINIPSSPQRVYKGKGWISIMDWLGTENLPFEQARDFVRKQNIKTKEEWIKYYQSGKNPINIPNQPWGFYKDKGWISIMDWLGTEKKAKI